MWQKNGAMDWCAMSRVCFPWATHSSHSTTVPWIWKNGRPMEVCHDCGDLRKKKTASEHGRRTGFGSGWGGGVLEDEILEGLPDLCVAARVGLCRRRQTWV